MTRLFDKCKLSSDGFFVDVEDVDVTLPNGEVVQRGIDFRNRFHLSDYFTADIFVPCGGRPKSVDITNVSSFFRDVNGTKVPKFKYIVEGANLFFTQSARLYLEEHGVIVYKDASANKGGVTSSSLEVLASLALTDEEFEKWMINEDSDFYQAYVKDVWDKITQNARGEFEAIWREHESTGTPRSVLCDMLSNKINDLNDSIQNSPLWNNVELRKVMLRRALPPTLLKFVEGGLDTILKRVPESYLKAIFGSHVASQFVYQYGLSTTDFSFFEYMEPLISAPVSN